MTGRNRQEPPEEPSTEAPEEGLVASTLAYVRTDDGVVEVTRGGTLPAGAIPEYAARLRDKGVFVTAAELAELDAAAEG